MSHRTVAIVGALALLIAVAFAYAKRAAAHDNGQYANIDPSIRSWVKGLTDQQGIPCCDTADGYPAEAEWDTAQSSYRVRIDGEWYVVPPSAVITQPNRLGYAVVWYWRSGGKPQIRCFLPGAGI